MARSQPERIEILGVPVDCVTMPAAVAVVDHYVMTGRQGTVIAVNPEKVIKAQESADLLEHMRAAALLIPDGIGMVWAARLLGLGRLQRVAGADLMPAICERAAEAGYGVFLFGASADVNRRACDVLQQRYPGLRIVGARHGYCGDEEMPELVEAINETNADILFIALGSPMQELWMARYLPQTRVKICQGVGGTFDVLAGTVKRAPIGWRGLHLEWLYRLLSRPGRIHRQLALPKFAWHVFRAAVSARFGSLFLST